MHFVLCYPKFSRADHDAVEAFRGLHEPARAKMARAHVTLVFGVTSISGDAVAKIAAAVASTHAPFDFALDGMEVEAHERGDHNLMLKVGKGRDELIALHRALYAGAFASERRTDIEFNPHVTIATNAELEAVVTAAADAKPLSKISGRIDALHVVTLSDGTLHPVAALPLATKS